MDYIVPASSPRPHCSYDPVNTEADDRVSVTSRRSHSHSHVTHVSSASEASSALARRDAMVESAASKIAFEFDQMLAKKTADYELQIATNKIEMEHYVAIHAAKKRAAIDEAKLAAIDQFIEEQEENDRLRSEDNISRCSQLRTEEWVQSHDEPRQHNLPNESTQHPLPNTVVSSTAPYSPITPVNQPVPTTVQSTVLDVRGPAHTALPQSVNDTLNGLPGNLVAEQMSPKVLEHSHVTTEKTNHNSLKKGFAGNQPIFVPNQPVPKQSTLTNHTNDHTPTNASLVTVNNQLAAALVRQNLPKFEPDVFDGDVTMFYPWKACFKNMLKDADISPAHELTLLAKYTTGEPHKTVDCYRKRLYRNPQDAVHDLWKFLDTKFGNTAAVAHAYLELLGKAANFGEHDLTKLQDLASICSDIKCQAEYLPALSCLDYAIVLQPTINKLPTFLRLKWEKIVVKYANTNSNAYPTFDRFANFIVSQADLQCHPNVNVGKCKQARESSESVDVQHSGVHTEPHVRVFKSATTDRSNTRRNRPSFCPIHELGGHNLLECHIFKRKTWLDKTDIVSKAGLCSRCLIAKHPSDQCKEDIKCRKCGSDMHVTQLHVESKPTCSNGVRSMCATVCGDHIGGHSYSKMLLIDVHPAHQPDRVRRVYAIVDDQSNTSMISPTLFEQLSVDGKKEAYTLSTCSGENEIKDGRRISNLVLSSPDGVQMDLPTCIECDKIPTDKREIVTPSVARKFAHLRKIADDIPDIDRDAPVALLIGRDAPEVLKVRSFINGPSGAPWAQKLSLGWTISGQFCKEGVSMPTSPRHIIIRKTTLAKAINATRDHITCPKPCDVRDVCNKEVPFQDRHTDIRNVSLHSARSIVTMSMNFVSSGFKIFSAWSPALAVMIATCILVSSIYSSTCEYTPSYGSSQYTADASHASHQSDQPCYSQLTNSCIRWKI